MSREGVGELLKGTAMQDVLSAYGEGVRNNCTAGSVSPNEFEVKVKVRGTRAVATVSASTPHARNSNLKHNTLLKAVNGG